MFSQAILSTIATFAPFIIPCIFCHFLAARKGYPRSYFLFGLLSIFGIIILAVLPYKNKETSAFREINK